MCVPTEIQLYTVKMVDIGPESDVRFILRLEQRHLFAERKHGDEVRDPRGPVELRVLERVRRRRRGRLGRRRRPGSGPGTRPGRGHGEHAAGGGLGVAARLGTRRFGVAPARSVPAGAGKRERVSLRGEAGSLKGVRGLERTTGPGGSRSSSDPNILLSPPFQVQAVQLLNVLQKLQQAPAVSTFGAECSGTWVGGAGGGGQAARLVRSGGTT